MCASHSCAFLGDDKFALAGPAHRSQLAAGVAAPAQLPPPLPEPWAHVGQRQPAAACRSRPPCRTSFASPSPPSIACRHPSASPS